MKALSIKGIIGLITGLILVTTAIILSVRKEDKFGDNISKTPNTAEITNKNLKVTLVDEFGNKTDENLNIIIEFDNVKNLLILRNYTENYSRKDWSKTDKQYLPTNVRHTSINFNHSRLCLFHPSELKVTTTEQKAFLVPQYSWDNNLVPFNEHKEAKMLIEGGNKIVSWLLSKIPIPFTQDIYDEFIKNAEIQEVENMQSLRNEINSNYTVTNILPYIPNKIIGYTETAREYKIQINPDELKGTKTVYLWQRVALGDPSINSENSYPNKYGESEYLIKFNITGEKIITQQKNREIIEHKKEETIKSFNNLIFYWAYRGDKSGIYMMDIEKQDMSLLYKTEKVKCIKLSPDKSKIIFIYASGNPNIYSININNRSVKQLTHDDNSLYDSKTSLSWTPDGNNIIFIKGTFNGKGDIYKMDGSGNNLINLTNSVKNERDASVSPDGKHILFVKSIRGSIGGTIYTMNLSGSDVRNLRTGENYDPYWSSNGEMIFFRSGKALYSLKNDGTNLIKLLDDIGYGKWQIYNEKISYMYKGVSSYEKNHDIFIMNINGSDKQNLTNNNENDKLIGWSPDGEYILFYTEKDNNDNYYITNYKGLNTRKVTEMKGTISGISWKNY